MTAKNKSLLTILSKASGILIVIASVIFAAGKAYQKLDDTSTGLEKLRTENSEQHKQMMERLDEHIERGNNRGLQYHGSIVQAENNAGGVK